MYMYTCKHASTHTHVQVVHAYDVKVEAAARGAPADDDEEPCILQLVRDLGEYVCSLSWGNVAELLGNEAEWDNYPGGHTLQQLRNLLVAKGKLSVGEAEWARQWRYSACPGVSRGARAKWCNEELQEAVKQLGFRPLPSMSAPPTPVTSRHSTQVWCCVVFGVDMCHYY